MTGELQDRLQFLANWCRQSHVIQGPAVVSLDAAADVIEEILTQHAADTTKLNGWVNEMVRQREQLVDDLHGLALENEKLRNPSPMELLELHRKAAAVAEDVSSFQDFMDRIDQKMIDQITGKEIESPSTIP